MREKVLAEVTVVDSRDAAMEVIRTSVPDVLLLSALLSPRDEDELIAFLRTLDAQHLQTHTIPQLASALTSGEGRGGGGLLSAFRRKKKEPDLAPGCDPDLFAEEIRTYLKRAEDKKHELQSGFRQAPDMRLGAPRQQAAPAPAADSQESADASSSWASPFEWKPSGASRHAAPIAHHGTPVETSAPSGKAAHDEPLIFPPAAETTHADSILAEPHPEVAARTALISEPGIPSTVSLIPNPESVIVTVPDEDITPRRVEYASESHAEDPIVVTREPSVLIPEPAAALVREPVEPMTIEVSLAEDAFPEITLVEDPVDIQERLAAPYAAEATDAAAETLINLDAVSDDEPAIEAPRSNAGFTFLDPGLSDGASAFTLRGQDPAGRDRNVGPLASWARAEKRGGDGLSASDDLRMLLAGLAVPPAIAGVRYPRGVRIRRVRVPASQAADAGDTAGPVILSRRALAEQREQTGA